jgi:hypothetical protein
VFFTGLIFPIKKNFIEMIEADNSKYVDVIKSYKKRWYILSVYSVLTCLQFYELLVFSAVPVSTEEYFWEANVDMGDINFSLSISTFGYVIFTFLLMYLDTYFNSLRMLVIVASMCILTSDFVRLIPVLISSSRKYCRVFLILGSFINDIGGSFSYSIPSKISATWFPANERTIATMVGAETNVFGSALSFLITPLIVNGFNKFKLGNSPVGLGIPAILWMNFLVQLIVTIVIFIYFPSSPPHPPSYSEEYKRRKENEEKKKSFKKEEEFGRWKFRR